MKWKPIKKHWIYSWLIYSNISFSNFIDNTFENWFLFLFINSLHFVIAIAIIGRMLSRFPVCFGFHLVWFFLVKCSWKNYKKLETDNLSKWNIFTIKPNSNIFTNYLNVMQVFFVIFVIAYCFFSQKKYDQLKIRECFSFR